MSETQELTRGSVSARSASQSVLGFAWSLEMASRLKEDERNERSIRNLLNFLRIGGVLTATGPQYVCTNFWTFVCTTCSGIHREFTHRVKSVSMAKFTSQEVSALQGGGNASAREIYFKEWDAAHQSLPDSSNVERLRDFIRLVYVNRRYTGEKSFDKPPRVKLFPSMAPLQGALPNIYRTSSLGTLPPAWMPTQPLPSNIQRTSSLGNDPSQASHHQLPMSTQILA
ncbi:hypothetical protein OSB04_031284 [Centaurea solstitialis]|uniref:Arf-GAP domain-containing protein n=1 Tax=Centaurea solstitialis TaxID=347529 RepID=A0AA38W7Z1_9ASTR|nr:hypothetical protein OSB04_031284 [Centaurea solstitialis]